MEKLQNKNNNVGLSEEVRMTDAVSDYVKKSRDYYYIGTIVTV